MAERSRRKDKHCKKKEPASDRKGKEKKENDDRSSLSPSLSTLGLGHNPVPEPAFAAKREKLGNARERNGEPAVPEELAIGCAYCERKFKSEKSLFGHLRVHSDRAFRGAYPPPIGWNKLAIDLNEIPKSEYDADAGESSETPSDRRSSVEASFDLNASPPRENDDGS